MTRDAHDLGAPVQLRNASGLVVQVNRNGSIRRIDHRDVVLNTFLGSEIEGGPANLYLRRRATAIDSTPLLGPRSPATVHLDDGGLVVRGEWRRIRFTLSLVLARSAAAWFWHVALENADTTPAEVDVVYAQDLALADYGLVRMNEYYVSQYLDLTPLGHARHGVALGVRQNLAMGDRHPWAVLGALRRGVGFATDALDLHGLATRAGERPIALAAARLPTRRLQHEHAMAVIQDEPLELAPGAVGACGFFGWFEPDHPAATSDADLAFVDRALALPEAHTLPASPPLAAGTPPVATAFSDRPLLECEDLDEAELTRLFGGERRQLELQDGVPLSFFTGPHRHVVLKAKERRTLRPHGHIIRTGDRLVPDEASLTSTVWMDGVFHSLVTQGHVNINRVLSTTRSYLGLVRACGLRIFIELERGWHLLGVPSAFAITPASCTWIYKHAGGVVRIESRAATARHELMLAIEVVAGPPRRFLLSHHVALGGDDGADAVPARVERDGDAVVVRTDPATDLGRRFPAGYVRVDPRPGAAIERVAGDEALFADGRSRRQPFVAIVTRPGATMGFGITVALTSPPAAAAAAIAPADDGTAEDAFWRNVAGRVTLHTRSVAAGGRATRIQDILPWFAHDALIHYLAPRGLDQFSGGGWGTRDVCQGPVELLLALGRWEAMRDLLLRVYGAQNPDGDWPQWFTFFDRDRGIRAADAHGDIVFWPLLALGQYLLASDDGAVLDTTVPFFHPEPARAETATILAHVERALATIEGRQIPGTSLVAYGHGDWDDSLQPVNPAMAAHLCSAWTVTLQVQTATTLARALRRFAAEGGDATRRGTVAARLETLAACTRADFQRLLVPDATVAGFAYFHDDGRIEYLLHPRDDTTGIHYRLLQMIHAILADLLTPEQARTHVGYVRAHLLAPDGARLLDRPPQYRGGIQRTFQRAESSSFFGREIGLMYVHAHLRYAEAMAHYGDAEAFHRALLQAIPIGIRDVVPSARLRQASCYTSSSDAAVADRYEAQERYDDVRAGRVAVEGGWRVYSSGAGIAFRLIHERLLGVRRARSTLTIDPVLPQALDGLAVDLDVEGRPVRVIYAVGPKGCDPVAVELNGAALPFARDGNPYRAGGAVVAIAALRERLRPGRNELRVRLA